jgi:hypothetical protein
LPVGRKRPKQSHKVLIIQKLPRSLRSLAMTRKGSLHSLQGGGRGWEVFRFQSLSKILCFSDLLPFTNILFKIVIYPSCSLSIAYFKKDHYLILSFLGKIEIGIVTHHHLFILQGFDLIFPFGSTTFMVI